MPVRRDARLVGVIDELHAAARRPGGAASARRLRDASTCWSTLKEKNNAGNSGGERHVEPMRPSKKKRGGDLGGDLAAELLRDELPGDLLDALLFFLGFLR